MAWPQYTWMIVVHGIVAFMDAYGIGANDVANAFGTSVGSKTLTMWSACCIAAVMEFLGAFLLGGQVTKTIAGGIAKTSTFAKTPQLFMFGMLTAETGAMLWILFATYLELPVSTTHSISKCQCHGYLLNFLFSRTFKPSWLHDVLSISTDWLVCHGYGRHVLATGLATGAAVKALVVVLAQCNTQLGTVTQLQIL
eukprot:GHUV01051793.1.p1 GENE.GHUV01051793.1~~GHUV01051793.1.p1  ORF type:complete len:196 (+),score=27.03 GHUV01051793.1:211-798(+)